HERDAGPASYEARGGAPAGGSAPLAGAESAPTVEPARHAAPASRFALEVASFIFEERARQERDRLAAAGLQARAVTTPPVGARGGGRVASRARRGRSGPPIPCFRAAWCSRRGWSPPPAARLHSAGSAPPGSPPGIGYHPRRSFPPAPARPHLHGDVPWPRRN